MAHLLIRRKSDEAKVFLGCRYHGLSFWPENNVARTDKFIAYQMYT